MQETIKLSCLGTDFRVEVMEIYPQTVGQENHTNIITLCTLLCKQVYAYFYSVSISFS